MSFWKVRLEKVVDIQPIPGADAIEVATVLGWKCVVARKDAFKVGDEGIYFPIDTALNMEDERFKFLTDKGTKRIKTIKMRKQISQGLFMPLSFLTAEELVKVRELPIGHDISSILGVTHYEPPAPSGGNMMGVFPNFIFKTSQERIQNIPEVLVTNDNKQFEVTEKCEGTSFCAFFVHSMQYDRTVVETQSGRFGVCSHNWEMKNDGSSVWSAMAIKYDLENRMRALGKNIAIQGEIIGPKIQDNIYKLTAQDFYVFDVFDIDSQKYMLPEERYKIVEQLGLKHVPVINKRWTLRATVDELLLMADGKSELADTLREGIVLKSCTENISFKAVSNQYLLKHG